MRVEIAPLTVTVALGEIADAGPIGSRRRRRAADEVAA